MSRAPMFTVRQLASDEFAAWQDLVLHSPQGGLFQTIEWNRMLCTTSDRPESFLPLVCEHKGDLLGGILLRCAVRSRKTRADLLSFGYNGPMLAARLDCAKHCQTLRSYHVMEALLKHVRGLVECAVVHNQPEIWDMRPFKYQGWRLDTSFTHILPGGLEADPWTHLDPESQAQFSADLEELRVDLEPTEARIHEFCTRGAGAPLALAPECACRAAILDRRIRWLLERGLGSLVAILDPRGREQALSLLLLSRENRTVYVWKTIPLKGCCATRVFPLLAWRASHQLLDGVEQIDLGGVQDPEQSRLRDRLGGQLRPRFSARL